MEAARAEIRTLEHIQAHLQSTRHNVRQKDKVVVIGIRQTPLRLLEVERRRMATLLRAGRRSAYGYADVKKHSMYRCGIPGRGGGILNELSENIGELSGAAREKSENTAEHSTKRWTCNMSSM